MDEATDDTRRVEISAIREALAELPDEQLAAGDADQVRGAIAQALGRVERDRAWREQLVGAGLDSPAGRRVLSAVRHAVAALPLDAIVRNVREARDADAAEQALARSLWRIDRDAAAELDGTPPNLLDAFRLPSGAVWLLPRDPAGRPLFWNRRSQSFEDEPRADRDWMVTNLTQTLGAAWRKQRVGTFKSIPAADAWCRQQPGQSDELR